MDARLRYKWLFFYILLFIRVDRRIFEQYNNLPERVIKSQKSICYVIIVSGGVVRFARVTKRLVYSSFIVATLVFLTLVLHQLETTVFTDSFANRVHEWLQFVNGSWPTIDENNRRRTVEFASQIFTQMVIGIVPVVGILLFFWRLVRLERQQRMNVMEMIRIRDQVIIATILNRIPPEQREEERQRLQLDIQRADNRWNEDHLRQLVGSDNLQFVQNKIYENVVY